MVNFPICSLGYHRGAKCKYFIEDVVQSDFSQLNASNFCNALEFTKVWFWKSFSHQWEIFVNQRKKLSFKEWFCIVFYILQQVQCLENKEENISPFSIKIYKRDWQAESLTNSFLSTISWFHLNRGGKSRLMM